MEMAMIADSATPITPINLKQFDQPVDFMIRIVRELRDAPRYEDAERRELAVVINFELN